MTFSPEFWIQALLALGGSVAVYAGIKSDLARLHEKAHSVERSTNRAHERIDSLMEK